MLLAACMQVGDLWALAYAPRALLPHRAGSLLYVPDSIAMRNSVAIKSLDPRSPLVAAGAQPGDAIRVDHVNDLPFRRALDTEESIGLTLMSGNVERRIVVTPARDPAFPVPLAWISYFAGWAARLLMLSVGFLLLRQRPESPGLMCLAAWLVLASTGGAYFLPGGSVSGSSTSTSWSSPYRCASWRCWASFLATQKRVR
jgi:hypothetical protein